MLVTSGFLITGSAKRGVSPVHVVKKVLVIAAIAAKPKAIDKTGRREKKDIGKPNKCKDAQHSKRCGFLLETSAQPTARPKLESAMEASALALVRFSVHTSAAR